MKKRESFRWRIFIYNVILLTMVTIVCTMYFLLNDETLNSYQDTFRIYNELNHFYDSAKQMKASTSIDHVATYYEKSEKAIKKINESAITKAQSNAFHNLQALMHTYYDSLQQQQSADIILQNYQNIMKTRGNTYEIVTKNMQQYKNRVNENREKLNWISIFMVIFILLWILYFSRAMIQAITNPIERIIHNMNKIKIGTYDLTQISNTSEEMNVLCLALEDMAKSVQRNIQNEKEKAELEKRMLAQQNESLKKDEQLAQGELKILQNQVNPHFLFNTLNLIYKKAYSEGAYETSELMEKTSQLLRYSLDNANKVSTLDKEIKAVENYMFIQDKRFSDRISFVLKEDEEVPNIQMPTMILQPLVENALIHGCKDTMEGGNITVFIRYVGTDIVLCVQDNGKGMSQEDVDKLRQHDYFIRDEKREHIGLYNITRRLYSFYGDSVRVDIQSEINKGFTITITIRGEDTVCSIF